MCLCVNGEGLAPHGGEVRVKMHLFKLVLPDEAARVAPVGARLRAEARRVRLRACACACAPGGEDQCGMGV